MWSRYPKWAISYQIKYNSRLRITQKIKNKQLKE